MQENRYVGAASARRALNEAIIAQDMDRLKSAIDQAVERHMDVEVKSSRIVLQLLARVQGTAERDQVCFLE